MKYERNMFQRPDDNGGAAEQPYKRFRDLSTELVAKPTETGPGFKRANFLVPPYDKVDFYFNVMRSSMGDLFRVHNGPSRKEYGTEVPSDLLIIAEEFDMTKNRASEIKDKWSTVSIVFRYMRGEILRYDLYLSLRTNRQQVTSAVVSLEDNQAKVKKIVLSPEQEEDFYKFAQEARKYQPSPPSS
jgi:hypothetical protein